MSPMPDFHGHAEGPAEQLIHEVFRGRLAGADPLMARLRLEHRLRRTAAPRRPQLRPSLRWALKLTLGLAGLLVMGGWASNITLKPWDDAQQVSLALPADWSPREYPRLIAEMRKFGDSLYDHGATSLIVDYKYLPQQGGYILELGVLGVDYQTANNWVRSLLLAKPELGDHGYSITQPLVPYSISVRDMLAFRLAGHETAVEQNVVAAWQQRNGGTMMRADSDNAVVYLVARDTGYGRRMSMVR